MLLLPSALALAAPRPPCGSPLTLPLLERRGPHAVAPPSPGPKQTHDTRGEAFPNELTSANFHVKWGNTGGVSEETAADVLEWFEDAWEAEVVGFAMEGPIESDGYLFNVYIGDTGGGTPSAYGNSGYYYRDDDGFPYIVIGADILGDSTWARGTAAHEFFHSLQDATGSYAYEGDSAWYWEATAMWVEGEVLEDYEDYAVFLYAFAMLPELPVYFFDYPDTGALQEYRQYGAMIFPRYLSEIAADADVVVDSWRSPGRADTPQEAIANELDDRGIAFADAFGDFAAHNAVWEYADGALYAEWVDYYAGYYRSQDHRVVAELRADGTEGLVDAPEDTLPERLGYNVVTLERPDEERGYIVSVSGATEGDDGSPADWRFTLVIEGDPVTYLPITLTDGAGEIEIEPTDEGLHLVAAQVTEDADEGETFAWSYGFTPVEAEVAADDTGPADDTGSPDDTDPPASPRPREEPGSCGCGTGSPASFAAAALGILAVARRRRD